MLKRLKKLWWTRQLRSRHPSRRRVTAEALGKLRNVESIPPLAECLIDSDEGVRTAAQEALNRIDREWRQSEAIRDVVSHFVKGLQQSRSYSRWDRARVDDERKTVAQALLRIDTRQVRELVLWLRTELRQELEFLERLGGLEREVRDCEVVIRLVERLIDELEQRGHDRV